MLPFLNMMNLHCICTDITVPLFSSVSSYTGTVSAAVAFYMAARFPPAVHPINRYCEHVDDIYCHFTVPSPDKSLCILPETIVTMFEIYLMLVFIMRLLQMVTFHSSSSHTQTAQEIIIVVTHTDHLVIEKRIVFRNTF